MSIITPPALNIEQQSLLLQAIFDSAHYSIITTSTEGTIRFFNQGAAALLGYSPEEVINKVSPGIFHKPSEVVKRAESLSKELNRKIEPGFEVFVAKAKLGSYEELQWSYIHKSGREIPVMLSVTALRDKDQKINGFLGIAFDISETVLAQKALTEHEQRYRLLYECAADGIFLMSNNRFTDCNPAALEIFGCTREQIIVATSYMFSPELQPDGRKSVEKSRELAAIAIQGKTQIFEWLHKKYDGTLFDAEVTLNSIQIKGEVHLLATVRDISARKATDRELHDSRRKLLNQNESLRLINQLSRELNSIHSLQSIADTTVETLLGVIETTHVAIYLIDKEQNKLKLTATNGFDLPVKLAKYTAIDEGVSGVSLASGKIECCVDFSKEKNMTKEVRESLTTSNIYSGIAIPLQYQGRTFGCINLGYASINGFKNIEIETLAVVGNTVSQAIANAHQIKDLDFMAHHDSLTGLANRLLFHTTFKQKTSCSDYQSAALLLLDLDRFKEINDTLGHYIGDVLLQQIGPRLNQVFAGHKIHISRLGGDEFTILIDHVSDDRLINLYATTLLASLREPFDIESMMLEIDASIGIAKFPQDGADSHELLRSADVAMYEAKRSGGGIKVYDINDDKHTPERLALIADLNGAIRDDQLELHFQPKINLSTGSACGFEALVRWRHKSMGLLYPDKFIPLAEMSDSIHFLTEAVIDLALKQQAKWCAKGYKLPVSVNLSARNLIDDRCVDYINKSMKTHGTQPGMLELEITETALMQDPETAAEVLNKIAKLGIELSIDDFGTGYSSLAYLRRLPINLLKIDREFVFDMLSNSQDSIIIDSTIALAHNLKLQVVAEGVEDIETLQRLREVGCDLAQGYAICKPKPWQDIEIWLEGNPTFFT